jgi:hypothetical protein
MPAVQGQFYSNGRRGHAGLIIHNDRAAAVEMGSNQERLHDILTKTQRISLYLIYRNEFRLPSDRNTKAKAKADDAIAELKADGKRVTEDEVECRSGKLISG